MANVFAFLCIVLFSSKSFAALINFDFDVDGVLPSSQGASYIGSPPETDYFSVSAGLLRQDSTISVSDIGARYDIPGFDNTNNAILEWRAKKYVGTGLGAEVGIRDGGYRWTFFITDDGMSFANAQGSVISIASFNTTDNFHNYKVVIPAAQQGFNLFIDDALQYSGVGPFLGSPGSGLTWGDGTAASGNAKIDWDYVRLDNTMNTVPLPASIWLFGTGSLMLLGFRKKKTQK